MKKSIVFVIIVCFYIPRLLSQDSVSVNKTKKGYYSAIVHLGVSTQVHFYPKHPEDETTAEGFLPTFGAGIQYTTPITSWLSINTQLNYLQKGCTFRGRVLIETSGGTTSVSIGKEGTRFQYDNKFHYIAADLIAVFKINGWKTKPYFQTGIRSEFLMDYSIEYDIDEYSRNDVTFGGALYQSRIYPDNSNYINFNRFNIGLINGFGMEPIKNWFVGLNLNLDLGYVVKNPNMEVRNIMLNLTFGKRF